MDNSRAEWGTVPHPAHNRGESGSIPDRAMTTHNPTNRAGDGKEFSLQDQTGNNAGMVLSGVDNDR